MWSLPSSSESLVHLTMIPSDAQKAGWNHSNRQRARPMASSRLSQGWLVAGRRSPLAGEGGDVGAGGDEEGRTLGRKRQRKMPEQVAIADLKGVDLVSRNIDNSS